MGTVLLIRVPVLVVVAAVGLGPRPLAAQPAGEPSRPATETTEDSQGQIDLPVSIDKIQRALSRPPAIKTQTDRPVFRVEIFAKKPTVADILGPDYLMGPVPYGGMTHQEFLNMVTPAEYRGFSAFTNREGITVAATSLALNWALMKAIDKLRDARNARAQEAARKEVLEAMNELEAARKKAGLPAR